MFAWCNGRAVTGIPVTSRGLAYGDGLFETIKVVDAHAQFLELHLQRLQRDCARLDIALDLSALRAEIDSVLRTHTSGVLKIFAIRTGAGRGYAAPRAAAAQRLIAFRPQRFDDDANARAGVAVRLCRQRLAEQPALAGMKHLNRLEQVLARAEWHDPAIAEGLLLDRAGRLVEGTFSNLFLITDGAASTPRLHRCGVAGVMRELVMQCLPAASIPVYERDLVLDDLYAADEVFLTNSVIGIWPVRKFECLHKAVGDVTIALQHQLHALMVKDAG